MEDNKKEFADKYKLINLEQRIEVLERLVVMVQFNSMSQVLSLLGWVQSLGRQLEIDAPNLSKEIELTEQAMHVLGKKIKNASEGEGEKQ